MEKDYYITLECGTKVIVDEEVYTEYKRSIWREENRDRDIKKRTVSLDNMSEFSNELSISSLQKSVEDIVLENIMNEKLQEALLILSQDEKVIVTEIYYNRRTERELAKFLNISQVGVHKRKNVTLEKLKNFFENKKSF